MLLNLIRGSGLEGIARHRPGHRDDALVQPLFDVEREEVEAFCRAIHLRPRRDPMNEDRRYPASCDPARGDAGPGARDGPGGEPVDREDGRPAPRRPRRAARGRGDGAPRRRSTAPGERRSYQGSKLRALPRPVASPGDPARRVQRAVGRLGAPWSKDAIEARARSRARPSRPAARSRRRVEGRP